MRVSRRAKIISGSSVVGLVTGSLIVILSNPANAASCTDVHENIGWAQSDTMHRGIVSHGVMVYLANNPDFSHNVNCVRISTLDMANTIHDQVEIGWNIDPTHDLPCGGSGTNDIPIRYVVVTVSDVQHCAAGQPSLTTGQEETLKATDPNKDGHWLFYDSGNQLNFTFDTTWTIGWASAQGERHDTSGQPKNSAHALFEGLQFIDATGPHDFDNTRVFCDTSNDYDGSLLNGSNTALKVALTNNNFQLCSL